MIPESDKDINVNVKNTFWDLAHLGFLNKIVIATNSWLGTHDSWKATNSTSFKMASLTAGVLTGIFCMNCANGWIFSIMK